MNRKILTIILAVLLIASFFLPIGTHTSTTPFDIVKGPSYGNEFEALLMKYGWLLIPVSGLMLLIGALNRETYFLGRGLWAILPLLAILYLIGRPISLMSDGFDFGGFIKGLGVGTWIALVSALVLAVYWPRK